MEPRAPFPAVSQFPLLLNERCELKAVIGLPAESISLVHTVPHKNSMNRFYPILRSEKGISTASPTDPRQEVPQLGGGVEFYRRPSSWSESSGQTCTPALRRSFSCFFCSHSTVSVSADLGKAADHSIRPEGPSFALPCGCTQRWLSDSAPTAQQGWPSDHVRVLAST